MSALAPAWPSAQAHREVGEPRAHVHPAAPLCSVAPAALAAPAPCRFGL